LTAESAGSIITAINTVGDQMYKLWLRELRTKLSEEAGISPRTLAWYIAEKLIPAPTQEGRQAYYDADSVDIYSLVLALRVLKKEFNMPLREASKLLLKHQNNVGYIVSLLGGLLEDHPVRYFPFTTQPYPDLLGENARNRAIRERFFEKLQKQKDASKISLLAIKEELEKAWKQAGK